MATGFTDIPAELLKAIPSESSRKKSKAKKAKSKAKSKSESESKSESKLESPRSSSPSRPPSTDTNMTNLTTTPGESIASLPISTVDSDTARTPSTTDETSSEAGKNVPSTDSQEQQREPADLTHRDGPGPITADTVIETSRAASKIFNVGLKAQMNFSMGVSRGFHNAPKLYGDDTVRDVERVTDIRSGFRAAGKVNFVFGTFNPAMDCR